MIAWGGLNWCSSPCEDGSEPLIHFGCWNSLEMEMIHKVVRVLGNLVESTWW